MLSCLTDAGEFRLCHPEYWKVSRFKRSEFSDSKQERDNAFGTPTAKVNYADPCDELDAINSLQQQRL